MQIDWLTVAAQIVNFLILVWLLQRFLYEPITGAMRRREERIEARLAEARQTRAAAEEEASRLSAAQQDLEDRREGLMEQARQEADRLRAELEETLRAEMADRRGAWLARLAEERTAFAHAFRKRAAHHVLESVRRCLADLADADLAEQLARAFARQLRALDAQDRERLVRAAGRAGDEATLESGTDLPPAAQGRIAQALNETLGRDIALTVRTEAELLLGLRLTLGDQTVEWSARRHLDRLEAAVTEALETDAARAA